MKYYPGWVWLTIVVAVGFLGGMPPAYAEGDGFNLSEGRWRLELSGATGLKGMKSSREGSHFATISVEYEVPVYKRLTLGLRLYPAFLYEEDHIDTLYAGGFGLAGRVYRRKDLSGFFAEIGGAVLVQSDKFPKNSSYVNFLTEFGLGYQFSSIPWHLGLKVQHISNAGLGSSNSGVNAFAVAVGYKF